MERKTIAIIGIGNYLMGDEGVGIHAVKKLEDENWPDDVEIIDGGTAGVALMYLLEGRELAIIIDCADFGGTPGEIGTFDAAKLAREERSEISLHATDLLSSLELAKQLGESYPERIVIIGIQPAEIAPTTSLSNPVEQSLEKLPNLVQHEIEK